MVDYNALQGPTPSGATLDTTQPGGFAKLLSDPNFQSLLAGVGARLDPQGTGGVLGTATQGYLNQKSLQKTAAHTQDIQERRHAELLAALAGGHTPKGVEGKTSTTVSGDKIVEKGNRGAIEYTETQPVAAAAPTTPGDYSTAVPAGTPPISTTPPPPSVPALGLSTSQQTSTPAALTPRNEVRNFYPFSRALLG